MNAGKSTARHTPFTLIELLVVVAIISILAAMLLPALTRARQTALRAVCMANMKQQALGLMNYMDSNEGYLPKGLDYLTGDSLRFTGWASHLRWDPSGGWCNLGRLYETGEILDGQLYFCPASDHRRYGDYTPWPTVSSSGGIDGSYWLNPYVYPSETAARPWNTYASWQPRAYQRLRDIPDGKILLMDHPKGAHRLGTRQHWNVMRKDTSVFGAKGADLEAIYAQSTSHGYPEWHPAFAILEGM